MLHRSGDPALLLSSFIDAFDWPSVISRPAFAW